MHTSYLSLTVSLMLVSGMVGVGVGYYLTPEYRLTAYEAGGMGLGAPDRFFDLRYLNAMIAHHRGAILMAEQARVSERAEIASLAEKILVEEPVLIDELYAWKREWYRDTRRVPDPWVARFGAYDDTFDLRFLNALIAHHDEGIVMTKETRVKTSRAEVQNNADAVEDFLVTTSEVLRGWRDVWYGR